MFQLRDKELKDTLSKIGNLNPKKVFHLRWSCYVFLRYVFHHHCLRHKILTELSTIDMIFQEQIN